MLWSQGFLTYIQDMTIHGFAVFLGLRAGLQRIIYHGRGVPARFNQLMEHGHSETTVSVGPASAVKSPSSPSSPSKQPRSRQHQKNK